MNMLIKFCLLKGSVTKTDNTWGYRGFKTNVTFL